MDIKRRRHALLNSIEKGAIVLFSGYEIQRSADEAYPFSVNRNFYYLTGINQKESYCVLTKEEENLYILDNDEKLARWIGYNLFVDEAKEISSFENVSTYSNNIDDVLKSVAENNDIVYLDLENTSYLGGVNQGERIKNILLSFNNNLVIKDIYQEIINLRAVKDSEEIEMLKHSIHITNLALNDLLKNLKYMNNEKECQSLFEQKIANYGHAETSFATIAASGKNATILHYSNNNQKLNSDDMILFDLGARVNFYNADISRTYPLNGKYEGLKKQIYELVLSCNKKIIEMVKPGLSISDLQEETKNILSRGLMDLGLINNKEELDRYYFHNVSHHLGLDTHDPMSRNKPLIAGNVITVEPGLYISEYNIGVRIEDDVLVTEDGHINLSQEIIKEISAIESLIKEND